MSTRYAYPAAPGPRASTVCDGCSATPLPRKSARRALRRAFQDGQQVKRFQRGSLKLARIPGPRETVGRLCTRCRKEARRA